MAAQVVISRIIRCMCVREGIMMMKSAAKVRPFCEPSKKKVWKKAGLQKGLTCLIHNHVHFGTMKRCVEKLLLGNEI